MKCHICRDGSLEPGTTTVTLDEGETALLVRDVPALICDNCGEEYFEEEVTEELLAMSVSASSTGGEVAVRGWRKAA